MLKTIIFKTVLGIYFVLWSPILLIGLISKKLNTFLVLTCAYGVLMVARLVAGIKYTVHYPLLEENGVSTGKYISIREALQLRKWDYVTMQQVSHLAPNYATYQPFLQELSDYVRMYAPDAKQVLHQTWAYEDGSKRLCEELGYSCHEEMFRDVKQAYQTAAQSIQAVGVIESGAVFEKLLEEGIEKVHRDTFHASLGLGRYALGLLWYRFFAGMDVLENTFSDFDEPIAEKDIAIVKNTVNTFAGI